MANIFPFRALRYDPRVVALDRVLTQPYDKISPEMQQRYYAQDEHNFVRLILGLRNDADGERDNVYTRAATTMRDWRSRGVLLQDEQPSIYVYSQHFSIPGVSGTAQERTGFIALGQIEDYEKKIVFRHEQTLSGPKADRLSLLRATSAHLEQIFMLYSDGSRRIDSLLVTEGGPEVEVTDEYGVLHRMWKISDPQVLATLQQEMAKKQLIIADGHHRYETAINYRNERRAAAPATDENAPYERMMMTFFNMEAEGLTILPTHRVVSGLPAFNAERFTEAASKFFRVEALTVAPEAEQAGDILKVHGEERTALLVVTADKTYLLRVMPGAADELLSDLSLQQRQLDVVLLHRVLLQHVLGLSEESIREQRNLTYIRKAEDAIVAVRKGANAAFLMNPVRMQQVKDIAFGGDVLPQKSTDFYPKLLSGLTVYAIE